ncbi:MAG: hypothetical protein P4L45_17020 [Ignavibacteriaceae bacterium]|nr:hypothetical protein [Ignavibacteriaceae bacterium]
MKKLFVLILFFYLPLFAQYNVTVYSGITTDNLLNLSFLPNITYKDGINLGISANYKIVGLLNVSPTVEYTSYKFNKFSPGIMLQEIGNDFASSNGDNLKNIRLALDVKLIKPNNDPFRVFVYTGVSYLIEDYGSFTEVWRNVNGTNSVQTSSVGEYYHFVHDFGLGFIVKIYENYGFLINGQYYSNYNGLFRYSANAGIVYNFAH